MIKAIKYFFPVAGAVLFGVVVSLSLQAQAQDGFNGLVEAGGAFDGDLDGSNLTDATDSIVTVDDNLTITATHELQLPLEDVAASPTINFGDGDSGIYESFDDILVISLNAARLYNFRAGSFDIQTGGSWALLNESASAVNPVLVPDSGDVDTGVGQSGPNALSAIAGATEVFRFETTGATLGAALELSLPQQNDPATPTLNFGDGDSGFHELSDDSIGVSLAANNRYFFTDANFRGVASGAAALLNTNSTGVIPNLLPDWSDTDTGIGANTGGDHVSIIAGGQEGIRVSEGTVAAGETQIQLDACTAANLGTPANGTFCYCSDCTIANPCAAAGTGALAKRLNGVWVCN